MLVAGACCVSSTLLIWDPHCLRLCHSDEKSIGVSLCDGLSQCQLTSSRNEHQILTQEDFARQILD